jgi:hypothetical protein
MVGRQLTTADICYARRRLLRESDKLTDSILRSFMSSDTMNNQLDYVLRYAPLHSVQLTLSVLFAALYSVQRYYITNEYHLLRSNPLCLVRLQLTPCRSLLCPSVLLYN